MKLPLLGILLLLAGPALRSDILVSETPRYASRDELKQDGLTIAATVSEAAADQVEVDVQVKPEQRGLRVYSVHLRIFQQDLGGTPGNGREVVREEHAFSEKLVARIAGRDVSRGEISVYFSEFKDHFTFVHCRYLRLADFRAPAYNSPEATPGRRTPLNPHPASGAPQR